jgi:hypothetical protein
MYAGKKSNPRHTDFERLSMNNADNLAAYIWSLADLLRGDFKQSQYGRVILPFTLLRRLEGVLEKSKPKVLEAYEKKIKKKGLPEEAEEKLLFRETGGLSFYNISKMDLGKLGEADIKVIKKVHKKKADPLYGLFEENKKVVEYQTDSDLRDNENIPLDPTRPVKDVIEEYFKKEVLPHVPEAWIDAGKTDPKDGEIGIGGYEIPFNRHFYVYKPPRPLTEIDADLDKVSDEIMDLLREVHS